MVRGFKVRKGIKMPCNAVILIFTLILNLFPSAINVFGQETNTIVILENNEIKSTLHTIKELEAAGFKARHVLSPKIILGYVSGHNYDMIAAYNNVRLVSGNFDDAISLMAISDFERFERLLIFACRKYKNKDLVPIAQKKFSGNPPPLNADAFDQSSFLLELEAQNASSSFMIGRVAVSVMLMESNGGAENWDESQEITAIAEVIDALDHWADLGYENNAQICWHYDIHLRVPTDWEPIEGPAIPVNGDFRWANDALAYFGYGAAPDGMYEYLHYVRRKCNVIGDISGLL
jgi:hypothetical protein